MQKRKPLCLAIDTASDVTSVTVIGDTVSAAAQLEMTRGQGEALMGLIQSVLKDIKKKPKDLTLIAVTIGPGSFTGVRIGLATARGLGLALNIPVLGVDNFLATAYQTHQKVTVILDSKRDDYFVQDFNAQGKALDIPSLKTTNELKALLPFTACGSGANRLAKEIGCSVINLPIPLSSAVAEIAIKTPSKTLPPHPLYLREADVSI